MVLRIRRGRTEVITSALVNSGFEAEEPQLIVPVGLAEALGLGQEGASIEGFGTAGGGRAYGYRIQGTLEVELLLEDREPVRARASITVLPGEEEVLISDRLASELGIVILDAWRGEWCLLDELGSKRRFSAPRQEWPSG